MSQAPRQYGKGDKGWAGLALRIVVPEPPAGDAKSLVGHSERMFKKTYTKWEIILLPQQHQLLCYNESLRGYVHGLIPSHAMHEARLLSLLSPENNMLCLRIQCRQPFLDFVYCFSHNLRSVLLQQLISLGRHQYASPLALPIL